MKRICTYLLLFCFNTLCYSQAVYVNLKKNMSDGNFNRCLTLSDSCFDKNYYPDSSLYYKAMVYLKMDKVKQAKKTCSALYKTYPAFTELHFLNGLICFSEENYGKSIDEFNLAVKDNPKNIKAIFNRSIAFGLLEEYLSAIEDLGACIELDPGYAQAYYSRAYWYEYTGNYAAAAKDYEAAIRLDPKNYDAYLGLAYVYQNQNETAKACQVISRAIEEGSLTAAELREIFCK